ncbi:Diaminopimelate epimerase-like protein [Didymella exigua CBS 183.55]|uniref:trans-L-3-hydroxyproline dehydratase n=1 Tax=Didymella exigua CBS 183.55 TaxID=1150837 RepID=A0A6A5R728_9PLEO|nr:Diaminopimelate epimerase-like protein [Didymella exigua CBS 183.55]KAF1923532.1 Diaminopimelate epimerase-like protein [Didymella exigua CBS 183.55]
MYLPMQTTNTARYTLYPESSSPKNSRQSDPKQNQELDNMASPYWIQTEDWHTAGEPFRIVAQLPSGSLPDAPSVAERRLVILNIPNHPLEILRQQLCHEPRGHSDMYGGFITPPDDPGAHFGVLFWHADGFSTACGHGTMALGYWAVTQGLVKAPKGDGVVDVVVDVPSGRVVAAITVKQGKPVHADFVNVLSYQLERDLSVQVPSRGISITANLTFGGAVYATVDAAQFGLRVEPKNANQFIDLGREIKKTLGTRAQYGTHDCYGVIFYHEDDATADPVRQTNVTVFADGQIDRSPCGSGTCARLAVLSAEGRVTAGRSRLIHSSIVGSTFEGNILSEEKSPIEGGATACIPRVRGCANLVGRMNFFIDLEDPVRPFTLR